jgi:hypothetical protein
MLLSATSDEEDHLHMDTREAMAGLITAARSYCEHYLESDCCRCAAARSTRSDPACATELALADAVAAWLPLARPAIASMLHPAAAAFPYRGLRAGAARVGSRSPV